MQRIPALCSRKLPSTADTQLGRERRTYVRNLTSLYYTGAEFVAIAANQFSDIAALVSGLKILPSPFQ